MTIYGSRLPGAIRIAAWASRVQGLTPTEKHRLVVLDWHRERGEIVSLTARHFGLPRKTVHRWLRRFRDRGLPGLKEHSRRPHRLRTPTTPWKIVEAVCRIRREHPTWSKYKIAAILGDEIIVSVSTVGRILKRRGFIDQKVSRKRQRAIRHPRTRFPRGLIIHAPGDLIQVDTKVKVVTGGKKLYQFTAIDVLTKLRVLDVGSTCSSAAAARFLAGCLRAFPFPIRAVQTDNGSEFRGAFDHALSNRGLTHYFGDPHWPRCQSYVERSHRTDEEEFYLQGNLPTTVVAVRPLLKAWERTYNTVRPHAALRMLTPAAYFHRWETQTLPTRDTLILQA